MKEKIINTAKCVLLFVMPLISAGFPARLFSLEYIDQRYHFLEDILIVPPVRNIFLAVIFSIYPSMKAAGMTPVKALNRE